MKNNETCSACGGKICRRTSYSSSQKMKNFLNTIKRIKSDIKLVESYIQDPDISEAISQEHSSCSHKEHHVESRSIFQQL